MVAKGAGWWRKHADEYSGRTIKLLVNDDWFFQSEGNLYCLVSFCFYQTSYSHAAQITSENFKSSQCSVLQLTSSQGADI